MANVNDFEVDGASTVEARGADVSAEPEFPTGEEGAKQLLVAFSLCEDPVLRHTHALRHVHFDSGKGLDVAMSRASMQLCRELIDQGVACSRPDYAEVFAAVALLGYGK